MPSLSLVRRHKARPVTDTGALAVLTLSTPSGLQVECLSVPAHHSVIAGAVIGFANRHGIAASMVRLNVLWDATTDDLPAVAA